MKDIKTRLIDISDILSSDKEVKDYHCRWAQWIGRNKDPEKPQNVHTFCDEHVVITKVWQYSEHVFRASVIQNALRRIDPYRIPGGYHLPFWHEYHYWQAGEQLFHASNRLREYGEGEMTITPKAAFDLRKKILFNDIVSVQLIFVKKKEKKDLRRIEEAHYTLFNRRNEVFGQTFNLCITTPMLYRQLWHQMLEGQSDAKEKLRSLIERQVRFARERFEKSSPTDFISRLEIGDLQLEELDRLFLFFSEAGVSL